ncbi:MAG: hypothetical protein K9K66_17780 [Desulfarculaceae bacterium]|nr:hypothetical protein [Desulfarculaceae bacterium]MCF8073378.1 hypothetical protein [Desulfarculaceae bacterium]MCF8103512.1 hypothetical protein [Desulfarculaceae bacterium]MCF8115789.1 hypothetical protein [Desulfarculaceae bacterium]
MLLPKFHAIPQKELLAAIYDIQAGIDQDDRDTACQAGCFACCTDQVYLTGLEGELLRAELARLGREDLLAKAGELAPQTTAPSYTFNQLAQCCLEQREPPADQENQALPKACFLLEGGLCAAYEARPLACRVMASQSRCAPGGEAEGDPWWFTLDSALMQIAEHVAMGSGYGSLAAVLAGDQTALLPCQPLPGLLAPPEHQDRLEKELLPLFARKVDGQHLGRWMDRIRQESQTGRDPANIGKTR